MSSTSRRPTVLLDVDDVLCPNTTYGGKHVYQALRHPQQEPVDLYLRLFSPEAVVVLNELIDEFEPRIVLTTSWLALFDRPQFEYVFRRCGLGRVADNLDTHWSAPTNRGESRLEAIMRWLQLHHGGEAFVVLDDVESGLSLVGSKLEGTGRVVFCDVGGCLKRSQLDAARRALRRPIYRPASSREE